MAEKVYVSLPTVRTHIRSILQKLGVNSQLEATALARSHGWRPEP
jgi:DNA-binding NarL/FixJ family response regulator